jgi:parallel beta-helix repeat protein
MRSFVLGTIVVLITLFGFSYLSMAEMIIYVDGTNGDDITGDGSETHPFATIQKGVDIAQAGDIVIVAEGIYNENIQINGKDGLILQGVEASTTKIVADLSIPAEEGVISITSLTGGTIDGFTIDAQHVAQAGISCTQATLTISNNTIVNSGLLAGIWCSDSSPTIVGNTITANWEAGIWCLGSSNPIISNNTIEYGFQGVVCVDSSQPVIGGSDEDGNNIIVDFGVNNQTPNTIDATHNYWGTTVASEIEAMLWNSGGGSVLFIPFADGRHDITGGPTPSVLTDDVQTKKRRAISTDLRQKRWPMQHKRSDVLIPKVSALGQNFPNPFNPETWIPYQLASDAKVIIRIYDVKGQLIRQLHLGHQNAGIYVTKETAAYWDGRDQTDQSVSSGMYFYTLNAGSFHAVRRMLILK